MAEYSMDRRKLAEEVTALLRGADFLWAVCGGYALDLFMDRDIRPHGDADICVFGEDRAAVLAHMWKRGWMAYEFRGMGRMRPLQPGMESEPGRNLMCLRKDCELAEFFPCEEPGLVCFRFRHSGLREFNYAEYLFNTREGDDFVFDAARGIYREMSRAVLFREGIPYLAPEIVLLYKSARADVPDYRLDFDAAYPALNDEQRSWFRAALAAMYPQGHVWSE